MILIICLLRLWVDILVLHSAFSLQALATFQRGYCFKYIRDAVADKRNAVFHYFCAYLRSV